MTVAAAKPRNDTENLAVLERLRPVFEGLKADRIRTESDLARYEQEIAEHRATAEVELGTSDLAQIRQMIQERRAENTAMVDQFETAIAAVKSRLEALPKA